MKISIDLSLMVRDKAIDSEGGIPAAIFQQAYSAWLQMGKVRGFAGNILLQPFCYISASGTRQIKTKVYGLVTICGRDGQGSYEETIPEATLDAEDLPMKILSAVEAILNRQIADLESQQHVAVKRLREELREGYERLRQRH